MEAQKLLSVKMGREVFRSRESDTGLLARKLFIKMHLERSGEVGWVRGEVLGDKWVGKVARSSVHPQASSSDK